VRIKIPFRLLVLVAAAVGAVIVAGCGGGGGGSSSSSAAAAPPATTATQTTPTQTTPSTQTTPPARSTTTRAPAAGAATAAVVARGKQLFSSNGCSACHSISGARGIGPSLRGVAGSKVMLADGTTVTANAAYLTRSIENPDAQIVAGFPSGVMSATIRPGSIPPANALALVAYIQTLR
jgi:mono/diheme cytochrome c family protein